MLLTLSRHRLDARTVDFEHDVDLRAILQTVTTYHEVFSLPVDNASLLPISLAHVMPVLPYNMSVPPTPYTFFRLALHYTHPEINAKSDCVNGRHCIGCSIKMVRTSIPVGTPLKAFASFRSFFAPSPPAVHMGMCVLCILHMQATNPDMPQMIVVDDISIKNKIMGPAGPYPAVIPEQMAVVQRSAEITEIEFVAASCCASF